MSKSYEILKEIKLLTEADKPYPTSSSKTLLLTCASFGLAVTFATSVKAEEFAIAKNPPVAKLQRATDKLLKATPGSTRLPVPEGEVHWDPDITYVTAGIYNPRERRDDKVRLRAYSGALSSPAAPYVAPTVELSPGNTFRVTLNNTLPKDDPTCTADSHETPNKPHCFNSTNMHFHGLWVNPAGNSDNVLIKINPGVKFQYEVNIPPDHPAGTFWYHPHLHGSTALQVGSGMAGALILRGDRLPSLHFKRPGDDDPLRPGDIDTLLRDAAGEAFQERVVLFQQIPYACRDEKDKIKKREEDGSWYCDSGETAAIEAGPEDEPYDQFSGWGKSGRYTMINGEVRPVFEGVVAGNIERWRMINAGIRESISPKFTKLNGTIEALQEALRNVESFDDRLKILKEKCDGDTLERASIATDGLTRHQALIATGSVMHAGYREDLLVTFPEPGGYCLIDGKMSHETTMSNIAKPQEILGFVNVAPAPEGSEINPSIKAHLKQALITTATNMDVSDDMKKTIIDDLQDDLKLIAFAPHKPILKSELTGYRTNAFNIYTERGSGPCSHEEIGKKPEHNLFRVGRLTPDNLVVDCEEFSPNHVRDDRILPLHGVEEWRLGSNLGSHPFHIHVNPFEVINVNVLETDEDRKLVLDKNGNPIIISDENGNPIDVSGPKPVEGSQAYAGLKGAWKDTLIIQQNHIVKIRTRYERYIGDFVLHCHILDHEDQGMMERVSIQLPGGMSH